MPFFSLIYCTCFWKNIDSELDDEESEDTVSQHEQHPGVDDGFFVGTRADSDNDTNEKHDSNHTNNHDNHIPHEYPPFPYAPGFNPNVVNFKNFFSFLFHFWWFKIKNNNNNNIENALFITRYWMAVEIPK